MGMDTRVLATRAAGNPVFFASLAGAVDGQMAYSPGGVIVRDEQGETIGGVGISGDLGDVDEFCAQAGIRASGLVHG